MTDHRRLILMEIFETEKLYVKDLQYIVDEWLKPLRSSEIISRGQLPDVFGNIELILNVNSELFEKLDKCFHSYPEGTPGEQINGFGEIFEASSRLLVCYHQFCSNHQKALECFSAWRKNSSKFDNFASEKEGTGLSLGSYLIKPVQRICKYPLLFRELLKHTPEGHPDRAPLEKASDTLKDVTLQINEIKRAAENLSKLHEVDNQISGFHDGIITEGRVFVKDGTLNKINPKKKIQERHFFLFSDILIWCEKGGVKKTLYRYRGHLELKSSLVKKPDPLRDQTPKGMIPPHLMKCSLQVVQMAKQKVYTLVAKDEKETAEWYTTFEKVIAGEYNLSSSTSEEKDTSTTEAPKFSRTSSIIPSPAAPAPSENSAGGIPTPLEAGGGGGGDAGGSAIGGSQTGQAQSVDSAELKSLEEKNMELSKRLKDALADLEIVKKEKKEMEELLTGLVERLGTLERLVEYQH
uniref:DH domain-containing protein n=1 Tax=Paramoeba aestuarina TaxID=180227 RepID=A0A7S4NWX6_9EUKA|eukprot:CAMPEP_0201508582 /NCGR_PEP_ID=MMETSP0161_2-20130828/1902_1 /ASSEMBLY_ACC=CAM_ASM_000251 /TAXON_ID=180227 /ORGANISM="Neoparamoeba aestuarina, Strain SoJaBio B1-5/56/2" /LENGTH=464 /DNA_ID=CAMNT_0047903301 /DNA_START=299 /DNA_END=1693 /DNA_ORIENTATION=+